MAIIHAACETGPSFSSRDNDLESVVLVLGQYPGYTSASHRVLLEAGVDVEGVGCFEANFDTQTLELSNIGLLDLTLREDDLWR